MMWEKKKKHFTQQIFSTSFQFPSLKIPNQNSGNNNMPGYGVVDSSLCEAIICRILTDRIILNIIGLIKKWLILSCFCKFC